MTVEPIELFSETRSSIIRLSRVEIGQTYYPSFGLAIYIESDGFTANGSFFVPLPEWKQFLAELLECERTRKGIAILDEIDHWDSSLTLESTDSFGHFDLRYAMRRSENSLTGRFSLDMEFFGQMVSGFKRLDATVSTSNN